MLVCLVINLSLPNQHQNMRPSFEVIVDRVNK